MSSAERTAPLTLWATAQSFLNTLFALFGPPEAIAFQHTHTSQQRALMLPWLRAGEALMRRLLLIEAAAYPKPNTPPRLWPKRTRVRKLVGFDDDKPETWRVSFKCFARLNSSPGRGGGVVRSTTEGEPDACALSCASPSVSFADSSPASGGAVKFWEGKWFTAKPTKFTSAWPLAERYEALIRVFNNPAPFAKRLAARLNATPHRIGELMRLPKPRARKSGEPADIPDLIGGESFAAIEAACGSSFTALNSS